MRRAVLLLLSGLSLAANAALPVHAQTSPPARAASVDPHAGHVAEASQRFGIPEAWIIAVKHAESAGDVRAISSAGAIGLMQIMPDTWTELRGRYRLGRNPYDPRDNILAGTAYLREMYDRYGTIPAMLAAYNAGPGRYDEHLTTGRALPAETRAYVALLAPRLGSVARPGGAPAAAPPPPDWREAPLFVMRSADARSANGPSSGGGSSDSRLPLPVAQNGDGRSQAEPIVLASEDTGGLR
ncbi:lytic transglycosylase domain-containing protein [Magnetospirillum sp. 64-120]|uniref:lytic transglycosylase domain-containing protein n=1 Tax=Magnetospirillum sp. 64-120 TaxID=1895778 RepID=UPI0009270FB1|nr:lytic transglycosylase domain-containing protein [Magnetospirillum sp. 64-120]OJX77906.1 MAG: lytic transglycosylase [Magnetospirillum sp. 64-120]